MDTNTFTVVHRMYWSKYSIQSIPILSYHVVFDVEPIIINKMEVCNYILQKERIIEFFFTLLSYENSIL